MKTTAEELYSQINKAYLANEPDTVHALLDDLQDYDAAAIHQQAYSLVTTIRAKKDQQTLVEAFLHEYQLNSAEGIVLMSIAEALLRIPDSHTQDVFLQEKLATADWHQHLLHSDSLLVNCATQAFAITAKIEQQLSPEMIRKQVLPQLVSRLGWPVIRTAIKQAMQQLAYQFVIAETIEDALTQAARQAHYRYSFDMLGEAAITAGDAERYLNAYAQAITVFASHVNSNELYANPSISIKLSALCPRYEPAQHQQAVQQITGKLLYPNLPDKHP